MKYVIDGYNVIHQIQQLQGKRLRSQREGLIRILEMAQAKNRRLKDLTVVFDGSTDVLAPKMHSTVKIIFTRGKSADKKIREIVESSNFSRDIDVVSDDRQIRSEAGFLGAKRVSVKEFLKLAFASCKREHSFKLDERQAKKINQELEEVWLNK